MLKEYRTLFTYMRPYWPQYVLGIISLCITSAFQLFIPQFIKQAVDIIQTGSFELNSILIIILWMLGAALLVAVGRIGWRYFLGTTARKIETEMREDLFRHLTRMDSSFYQEMSIGDLMARSTNDLHTIRMAASMALVAAFDGIFMGVAILIILFRQNPALALSTVIPLPFITVLIIYFGKVIGPLFKKVQEGFADLSGHSQETFGGIRVIKSFVKEEYFLQRFQKLNGEYRIRNMKLMAAHGLFFPMINFLSGLTVMILLLKGGQMVFSYQMTTGELVATITYLQMMIWPMMGAGFTVNLIQRGAASLSRYNGIISTEPAIQDRGAGLKPEVRGAIEIQGLSVKIEDSTILDGVEATIPAGALVGITGPVGSGKTTLLNCLPRLAETTAGAIKIDGTDIHELELGHLRSSFGYVPQRSFLFSATIRDNIAFGKASAGSGNSTVSISDEELSELTSTASLDQDFKLFPKGWQTVVGERGITISGGQKQRVSIARALASDPKILLLDDPLSAVDADTEERILEGILKSIAGRTTIIVSHRISTLKHCDNILVIEGGRITQSGTHDDLRQKDGYYKTIHSIQQIEGEKLGGIR